MPPSTQRSGRVYTGCQAGTFAGISICCVHMGCHTWSPSGLFHFACLGGLKKAVLWMGPGVGQGGLFLDAWGLQGWRLDQFLPLRGLCFNSGFA